MKHWRMQQDTPWERLWSSPLPALFGLLVALATVTGVIFAVFWTAKQAADRGRQCAAECYPYQYGVTRDGCVCLKDPERESP